jgi:DNA-binding response OmpR family regulator
MTNLCPTCGNAVPNRELIVSLETNTVLFDGNCARLTGQQAEILDILATASPRTVTTDGLIAGLYGRAGEPASCCSLIRTQMSKIRRKIAALGLEIKHTPPRGYTLHIPRRQISKVA